MKHGEGGDKLADLPQPGMGIADPHSLGADVLLSDSGEDASTSYAGGAELIRSSFCPDCDESRRGEAVESRALSTPSRLSISRKSSMLALTMHWWESVSVRPSVKLLGMSALCLEPWKSDTIRRRRLADVSQFGYMAWVDGEVLNTCGADFSSSSLLLASSSSSSSSSNEFSSLVGDTDISNCRLDGGTGRSSPRPWVTSLDGDVLSDSGISNVLDIWVEEMSALRTSATDWTRRRVTKGDRLGLSTGGVADAKVRAAPKVLVRRLSTPDSAAPMRRMLPCWDGESNWLPGRIGDLSSSGERVGVLSALGTHKRRKETIRER